MASQLRLVRSEGEEVQAKTCTKCDATKPLSEFSRKPRGIYGRDSRCLKCMSAYKKAYYATPGGRAILRARMTSEKSKAIKRNSVLKTTYGLSNEAFAAMLAGQGGRCANPACRSSNPGGKGVFHVDHDHRTGKVRGLLCHGCNIGLGCFGDSVALLLGAAEYLRGK